MKTLAEVVALLSMPVMVYNPPEKAMQTFRALVELAVTGYAEERVKEALVLRGGAMQAELSKNFEANCQRIRAEALEEAAAIVDGYTIFDGTATAAAIRALKGKA